MQWLAAICVRRPVFATVLILALTVVGIVGYFGLGVDRFPKVDIPTITVTTRVPGASPKEIESEVTDKVEEALNTISGIDELRSVSSEGVSLVYVTFQLEKDVDVAAQEVRDHLNAVIPLLPQGIDLPTVTKLDPDAAPILYVSLNAKAPIRDITEVADKVVRRQIESAAGVGAVQILGGRKRQINVWLDPIKMAAFHVTAPQVEAAIATQNVQIPGGQIETGPEQLTLRIRGRVESVEELGKIVVAESQGRLVRVADLGRVEDGEEDAETAAQKNGTPAVVLSVQKQSGENTIAVVDAVRTKMNEIGSILPPGYTLEVVRDNSAVIRTSANAVKEHLIEGSLFAAIIVLFFLGNARATFIAAIAIPTSIISTFALMWVEKFTLNSITLLALALAVGIVIDDAIVVLENIFRFIEEKRVKPFEAATAGTKEIGLAVLATTLSLIAVFAPVAFMTGIVGRFLKSFGLTMAFSIAVSLFVSFTLTPMLSARMLEPHEETHGKKPVLARIVDVFYRPIERGYMAVLRPVMRHRWIVVVMCLVALGSIGVLMKKVNKGFLPTNDEAQFEVSVRAAEGTSIEATNLIAERIARDIRAVSGVEFTLVTIGDNEQRTPNLARIYVRLVDPEQRPLPQIQMMAKVRNEIVARVQREQPDLRVNVAEVAAFSGGGNSTAAIQYVLAGPDLDRLSEYSTKLFQKMKAIPGAVDVDSTLILGKPEIVADVDRPRAGELGARVADVSNALRLLVGGLQVSTYEENGEEYEVHARAEQRFRMNEQGLTLLTVPSAKLGQVPLVDVVALKRGEGPSQINRLNRRRQVTMSCNAAPGFGESQILDEIAKDARELGMPAVYSAGPAGRSKELAKASRSFVVAFGMSFIFMYLILAAQFESWLHPVTILLALPLTLPFALISLLFFHDSLNIFSALGILVLFGVVKKNSILQIDHTNQLRARGMARLDAILQANKDRLRPILMTTAAFVAGMIPLALSRGIGAGFNRATANVVVGGQVLSLFLTLLATPVAYSLFDDAIRFAQRIVAKLRGKPPTPVAPPEPETSAGE